MEKILLEKMVFPSKILHVLTEISSLVLKGEIFLDELFVLLVLKKTIMVALINKKNAYHLNFSIISKNKKRNK